MHEVGEVVLHARAARVTAASPSKALSQAATGARIVGLRRALVPSRVRSGCLSVCEARARARLAPGRNHQTESVDPFADDAATAAAIVYVHVPNVKTGDEAASIAARARYRAVRAAAGETGSGGALGRVPRQMETGRTPWALAPSPGRRERAHERPPPRLARDQLPRGVQRTLCAGHADLGPARLEDRAGVGA